MIEKSAVKILIVDDDWSILQLHAHMLANLGFTSVTTYEGAVRAAAEMDRAVNLPDLILLDLNMPGMDGIEFVRYLVKRNYSGSLILLSGEDERVLQAAERLVQSHQITILGHLRKPAKQEGLGKLMLEWTSNPQIHRLSARKIYTADEVRAAIANGEIINHYQPIVSLKTRDVIGVEALARWMHPQDGLVHPERFVDVAEQNNLICDLTRVVIRGALAQLGTWKAETGLELRITINVSMDDLASVDFADYVAGRVASAGVSPQQVTLEVTESKLMKDRSIALDVLTRLRLKRFRIAIDDFGTGYSSLNQLRDIPFDALKIDRGFVHGSWSDRTVRAIFNMSVILAKQLNMGIVAEGVEDWADWDFVRRSGCDTAQGYFIARPMSAEELYDWIEGWKKRTIEMNTDTVKVHEKGNFSLGTGQLETLVASIVEVTKLREPHALRDCIARAIADLTDAKSLTIYHLQPKGDDTFVVPELRMDDGVSVSMSGPDVKPFVLSSNALLANRLRSPYAAGISFGTDERENKLILPLQDATGEISAFCEVENARNDVQTQRVLPLVLEFYSSFLTLLDDNERDLLTGLLNRKTFDLRISKILTAIQKRNSRSGDKSAPIKYCLAAMDIDHFKRINDTYGHTYGDEVLLLFSNLMKMTFRDNDLLFRVGGEEFVVLLATLDIEQATIGLERFRVMVENYKFLGIGKITVSIGVALISSDELPRATMNRADQALYFAKQNGRNQIRAYETLVEQELLREKNIQTGEIVLF